MDNKFLLLMGPSGAGKTTVIQTLRKLDERIVYISPYITRPLRAGEHDKVPISIAQLKKFKRTGQILTVNKIYGVSYATPIEPINKAFAENNFPILDWPIDKLHIMEVTFPNKLFRVYLEPPNLELLQKRLEGRDPTAERFKAAKREIGKLLRGEYDRSIDFRIVNSNGGSELVANMILEQYLKSISVKG